MANKSKEFQNQYSTEKLLAMPERKIIDLSIAIENDVASDPEPYRPHVTYHKHRETYDQLLPFFPGLDSSELRDQEAWAVEELVVNTHNGTHMDAPYHYHSTMDGGRPAWTIEDAPLDWCFRPGVKLDFRSLGDGEVVTAEDIEKELLRIDYQLQPLDIVLINTRAGGRYGEPDYINSGCGMGYIRPVVTLNQRIQLSYGKGIKRARISATSKWKNFTISKACRLMVSRLCVFR